MRRLGQAKACCQREAASGCRSDQKSKLFFLWGFPCCRRLCGSKPTFAKSKKTAALTRTSQM